MVEKNCKLRFLTRTLWKNNVRLTTNLAKFGFAFMSEQCKAYKFYPDFKVTKPKMINRPFINSIRGLVLTILQCSD